MPQKERRRKTRPANRAEWSFGQLLDWHFREHGSRPNAAVGDKAGRLRTVKEAAYELRVSEQTFRYWLNDEHPPLDATGRIEKVLFGDSSLFDDQRLELRAAFQRTFGQSTVESLDGTSDDLPISDEAPAREDASAGTPPANGAEPAANGPPANGESLVDDGASSAEVRGKPDAPSSEAKDADAIPPPHVKPTETADATEPGPRVPPRNLKRAAVAGLVMLVGAFVVVQWKRNIGQSGSPQSAPVQHVTAPVPPAPAPPPPKSLPPPAAVNPPPPAVTPAPLQTVPPPAIATPAPLNAVPAPAVKPPPPSVDQPAQVAPPHEPTEAEQQQNKIIAERLARFAAEQRAREAEARRLDASPPGTQERETRETETQTLAGMGYRVQEGLSASGSGYRRFKGGTIVDCARACDADGCDAVAYDRSSTWCYLYRKPFTPMPNAPYALATRVPDPPANSQPNNTGSAPFQGLERFAQAGTPVAPDGLVNCPTGPVKVTGFQLTCDQILSGGTTLGSAQLSYSVANINECAAKCRPLKSCVGFTYNGVSPNGRHSCMIFGPTPEGRHATGWISGVR